MIKILLIILTLLLHQHLFAQKPSDGSYEFKLCYGEGTRCFNTCTVIIKDDSVTIYANDDISVPKGEIIDQGVLRMHKSGRYIIARKPEDINAKFLGSCRGPIVIDFKRRRIWAC